MSNYPSESLYALTVKLDKAEKEIDALQNRLEKSERPCLSPCSCWQFWGLSFRSCTHDAGYSQVKQR